MTVDIIYCHNRGVVNLWGADKKEISARQRLNREQDRLFEMFGKVQFDGRAS
jgi:hypothetical protein